MHPAAAPHLTQVPRYVPGRLGGMPLLPLASNESPHGPSPVALAAAHEALTAAGRYPLDGAPVLAEALATRHGLCPTEVRVTNGATEAITLLCRAFVGEVVVSEGTFPAYARSALGAGSAVRAVPRRGWHVDLEGLRAACGPETRLLFLANPDNPTGTAHDRAALESWLWRIPRHVVVVIDEAYLEYSDPEADALLLRGLHPNLVVLRSFSKAHGLAALRVGWLWADAEIAQVLDRVRDPFNLNAVGIAAALGALADPAHLDRVVRDCAQGRAHLTAALRLRGLSPVPSAANFVCLPVPCTGSAFAAGLADRGIAVRALDAWGLPGTIRITVATPEAHDTLLHALDALLQQPAPTCTARAALSPSLSLSSPAEVAA